MNYFQDKPNIFLSTLTRRNRASSVNIYERIGVGGGGGGIIAKFTKIIICCYYK
jgi:hypothetical protein